MRVQDIHPGDVVQVYRNITVNEVGRGRLGAYVAGEGEVFNSRSFKFKLLQRKRPPKPKAGDTITGKVLQETMWKRGTLVRDIYGSLYVLTAEGKWLCVSDNDATTPVPFWLFGQEENLTLEYVA